MAENVRELLISIALSSRIKKFDEIEFEGRRIRSTCAYFNGKYCEKFKLINNSLVASWVNNDNFTPHPILCFVCPYHSLKRVDNSRLNLDLLEFYSYYSSLKEKLEREAYILGSRMGSFIVNGSILFKRRREEILVYLDNIKRKLEVLRELIILEQTLKH